MASPYAPINAGQLLFGPVTKVLRSMTQERRARQEREGVRAENRRRYEAGLELEAARYAEQQRQAAEDLRLRQLTTGTLETAAAAEEEYRRRRGLPSIPIEELGPRELPIYGTEVLPVGPAGAADLLPWRGGEEPPVLWSKELGHPPRTEPLPTISAPYLGPSASGAPASPDMGVSPRHERDPRWGTSAWVTREEGGAPPGYEEVSGLGVMTPWQEARPTGQVVGTRDVPAPSDSFYALTKKRIEREKREERVKRRRASGRTAAGHLREALMADPTGEGAGLIFQMDTKGAPPVSEDAVVISVKRGLAAMREQQLKRARAGRTVRGPQPEAASRRLTPALKRGDRAGFVRVYSSVYGETDPADVGRMFDQYLSDRIEDAIAKAEARANDKRFSKKHTRLAQIRQLLKNTYDPRVRAPYEEEAASLVSDIEDMDARLSYSGLPKRLVAAAMGDVDGGSDASKEFMQKFHDFDTQVEAMEFISKFAASPGWKSISPSVQSLLRRASRLPPERRREVISGFLKP